MNCWPRLPCGPAWPIWPSSPPCNTVSRSNLPLQAPSVFPSTMGTFARDNSPLFPHAINGRRVPLPIAPSAPGSAHFNSRPRCLDFSWLQLNRSWPLTPLSAVCCLAWLCLYHHLQLLPSRKRPPCSIQCDAYQRISLSPAVRTAAGHNQEPFERARSDMTVQREGRHGVKWSTNREIAGGVS